MRAVDLIRRKRDGGVLGAAEIEHFVAGVTDGSWPDYQVAALLMAIVLRGMDEEETARLTDAMTRSGTRLRFDDVPGPKVDKHSTGGVGDKTSIVLAPLVAACGVVVPMMSGRGLGHTGGTLDKLEAIPGFRTELGPTEVTHVLRRAGCCIFSQSREIAPADRRLYALRDVTATVESIPLITASILSKKLAERVDALVMDVKVGRGAFMKTEADARALAESLVRTGRQNGVSVEALLTCMDAPLGRAVGNALEIAEAVETLRGRGPDDLESLVVALATRMVIAAGVGHDDAATERRVRDALASGAALERFLAMVEAQGGDPTIVASPGGLPTAPGIKPIAANRGGFLCVLDAEAVGRAALALGAGRDRVDAHIDPSVGVRLRAKPGDRVDAGATIAELYHRDGGGLEEAVALMTGGIRIADAPPTARPVVLARVA